MKKTAAFAAAVVLAAELAGTKLPEFGAAADTDVIELPIIPAESSSSSDEWGSSCCDDDSHISDSAESRADEDCSRAEEHKWSESEEEAKARALKISIEPVMVFKDGSTKKIDIPLEHTYDKGYTSYSDNYQLNLTREETDKMLSDVGKKYEDIDRFDYNMTIENGEDTDYDDSYMLEASIGWNCIAYPTNNICPAEDGSRMVQAINTTKTYSSFTSLPEDYDNIEINYVVAYSGAKVYQPTEGHKKAMMVNFQPKVALLLDDGSEIMTDIKLDLNEDNFEKYTFSANVTAKDISKYLSDNNKALSNLEAFVGYFDSSYPAGQGINEKSVITDVDYSMTMAMKLKPGFEFYCTSGTLYGHNNAELPAKCKNEKVLCNENFNCRVVRTDDDSTNYPLSIAQHVESFDLYIKFDMHDADMTNFGDAEEVKGDVNGDGRLDVTDLSKTAAHVKGKKFLSDEQQKAADLSGDGKVNVADISLMAAHIKGKK